MANYKGAGLTAMKKQFADLGPEKEQALLAKLTDEEKRVYSSVLTSAWISLEIAGKILHKGAEIISPLDLELGLHSIGLFQARYNLAGIYKPILRIATVNFAIQQSARLWNSYFDRGIAHAQQADPSRNFIVFTVDQFPDLPYANRIVVRGYMVGTLEFTGAKDIRATHHGDSQSWKWDITWK